MPQSTRKDDVIQIRASAETKAILNRAATLRGQKLSEFMLDSARREAEEAILDQRVFFLAPEAHGSFPGSVGRSASSQSSAGGPPFPRSRLAFLKFGQGPIRNPPARKAERRP